MKYLISIESKYYDEFIKIVHNIWNTGNIPKPYVVGYLVHYFELELTDQELMILKLTAKMQLHKSKAHMYATVNTK